MPPWAVLQGGLLRSERGERPALIRSAGGGLNSAGKKALVDELVVITGYHRKSVLRALNRRPISADGADISAEPHRHHRCRYGPEVMEALVPLWEASDRLCGKRLQALLPLLLESLERHGHLVLDLEVREKLLTISSATIDRLLAPVRKTSPGNGWRRPPRARSAVQRRRPAHKFNGWGEVKEDGWLEIGLVAHCGKWMEGRFLWTLVATEQIWPLAGDRVPATGRPGGRRAAGGAVRGPTAIHQPLPALVQAQGDDPRGRQAQAAPPSSPYTTRTAAGA